MWRVVAALGLTLSFLAANRVSAQTAVPRFVEAACPFHHNKSYVEGTNLRCGYLLVPENRADPSGRTIKLAVAIFRTPSPERQPDPIIFLQGGPGGEIVAELGSQLTVKNALSYMGDRDLILIDQRGTGLSKPVLDCPEVDQADAKALARNYSQSEESAAEAAALSRCRQRLVDKGIDIAAYTTQENAADIADLRVALNLPTVNLYGVSYGTRLALAVMRAYPAGIRSVVLDSIVPPQYNIFIDSVTAEAQSFNKLFSVCKHAAACRQHFPHLKRTFDHLLRRLQVHPLIMKTKVGKQTEIAYLNGMQFAEWVRSILYVTPVIATLPSLIMQVDHRQRRQLARIYQRARTDAGGIALGMYKTVTCAEDAPGFTDVALKAAVNHLYPALQVPTRQREEGEITLCRVWNVPPASPEMSQPVTSDIPTLLLGGELDPITRPHNITIVDKTLSHSYGFVFPGTGHGVYLTNHCPDAMIHAFFDQPTQAPDSACIASMKEPNFTHSL